MRNTMYLFFIGAIAVLSILAACDRNSTSDEGDIRNGVDGKYAAYFNPVSSFESGDKTSPPASPGFPEAEATPPVGWYRAVTYASPEVWIHFSDPSNADVLVHYYIEGTMYIDRTDDYVWNPGSKEFAVTAIKEGKFIKQDGEWILTHITPGEFRLTDGGQIVEIQSVNIHAPSFDRTYSDPKEMLPLSELPHFQPGDELTVTVVATNSSTEGWEPECFAYIHHDKVRDPMTNTATETYVREYTVGNEDGVHHGCADVLDAGTLMTEDGDDYNGSAWAMPYYVGEVPTI